MADSNRLLLVLMLLTGLTPRPALAQWGSVELLAAVEFWDTDAGSRLLARNEGRPAVEGLFNAWAVLRPHHAVTLLALVEGETGQAEEESELVVEQLVARVQLDPALAIEGGRLILPLGGFAQRRFANTNPLIGAPDTYPTQYPWGVQLSGGHGPFDYRAALLNEPVTNERYLPPPGKTFRPVLAIGFRTGPDFRLGVSGTIGPYLGSEVDGALPGGADRDSFREKVFGLEARYSRGHLEAWGELLWTSYEVPTIADPVTGLGGYIELRATFTPRLYLAGRFERNRYAFVLPVDSTLWIGTARTVLDGEIALGYRLTRDFLVKASYRRDHWPEADPPGGPSFPDGHAVAIQASYFVDVGELLAPKY